MIDENMIEEMVRIARKHELSSLRVGEIEISLDNTRSAATALGAVQQQTIDAFHEREEKLRKQDEADRRERDERDLVSRLPRLDPRVRD